MKKVFKLIVENKSKDRQVDSIKNEIRKYVKREKNKKLPEEFNFWSFECKAGKSQDEANSIEFKDIIKYVDFASSENFDSFYLEIIAKAVFKEKKQQIIEDENLE
ncbi:DUF6172 family protein [Aliarcobacter vitoriensis]|uniref:Uncharacterized protein n=1 Tax=Aliarcobacter vitoriensis TaxID=2011099 RepID=A0A366MPC0_9BACT|nr:DUF6172 family protein [Aliarcobacter vitoriensis]RBQ28106.1 hypothetical protein CRU91_10850 [Aliarcobacter vitoriensis]